MHKSNLWVIEIWIMISAGEGGEQEEAHEKILVLEYFMLIDVVVTLVCLHVKFNIFYT